MFKLKCLQSCNFRFSFIFYYFSNRLKLFQCFILTLFLHVQYFLIFFLQFYIVSGNEFKLETVNYCLCYTQINALTTYENESKYVKTFLEKKNTFILLLKYTYVTQNFELKLKEMKLNKKKKKN